MHSPFRLVQFCWFLKTVLIYSKLHSKSCDYLYKKGTIRDLIVSMRGKQFARISNDFQMSVIKIITIVLMIENCFNDHQHNYQSLP